MKDGFDGFMPFSGIAKEAYDYFLDSAQRSILFMDALRKRGNTYIQHLDEQQPPVLVFKYEILMDARTFEKNPANYALAKIIDRRAPKPGQKGASERRSDTGEDYQLESPTKRPIVIIDPRAGHGPGIGGSKQDSEIGMALSHGHPVYFIFFYTNPMPNQTLADVKNAEVKFLEEIRRRHPAAPAPAIMGNCQGGWASALLAASRPDLAGPLVLNGSPLSYWSGVDGKNPMRYKGGLLGGVWMNSLLSDISDGKFDGANLVMNMEMLNPANTNWKKLYNVYSNIDTEEDRFLDFEKWWGGFFWMTKAEIHKIVDGLFIGNHLVKGDFTLDDGEVINLKNFGHPVVVFASEGDNITPPQQALNWIVQVYGTVDEIKRNQQVIVYIIHPKIGHLGIFVASSIAKKEQSEIIGSVEMINYLAPGLYEMIIEHDPSKPWLNDYEVKFEERTIADLMALDDGFGDEDAFGHVAALSEINDSFYNAFISPLVKAVTNRNSALALKLLHPLRVQRYVVSDVNPSLIPVATLAPYVKENRVEIGEQNRFRLIEKDISDLIEESWNLYRDLRDMRDEALFKAIYTNPLVTLMIPSKTQTATDAVDGVLAVASRKDDLKKDKKKWGQAMEDGGYADGLIRVLAAVIAIDKTIEEIEIKEAGQIIRTRPEFRDMKIEQFRALVAAQFRMIQVDSKKALAALPKLLKTPEERAEAIKFAHQVAAAGGKTPGKQEKELIAKIEAMLK